MELLTVDLAKDSKLIKDENHDCVVRAIANACKIGYDEAHKIASEQFNRQPKRGTQNVSGVLKQMEESKTKLGGRVVKYLGWGPAHLPHLFDKNEHGRRIIVNSKRNEFKTLLRNKKDYPTHIVGYTVATFCKAYNRGTFLLLVAKHALVVRDGKIIDNPEFKWNGWSRDVQEAFQIKSR